jgi:hypothetical protein
MVKVIYWHTCGLREVYDSNEEHSTGDVKNCPELGVSPEGTACRVFVEVVG